MGGLPSGVNSYLITSGFVHLAANWESVLRHHSIGTGKWWFFPITSSFINQDAIIIKGLHLLNWKHIFSIYVFGHKVLCSMIDVSVPFNLHISLKSLIVKRWFGLKKKTKHTQAGVAQWIERWPANRKVVVLFPVRAHSWVVCQAPSWGRARGNQSMYLWHIDVLLPPSPSL